MLSEDDILNAEHEFSCLNWTNLAFVSVDMCDSFFSSQIKHTLKYASSHTIYELHSLNLFKKLLIMKSHSTTAILL